MTPRPRLAWALALGGCAFPEPFACGVDADCRQGAVCVEGRCTAPDGAGAADLGPTDAAGDAVDAVDPPTGPCARFCPGGAPCEGLVPVVAPGFEQDSPAWLFDGASRRTPLAIDGATASVGRYMGEARVDWVVAPTENTGRFSQRLGDDSLPAGAYRLCFHWRVVSGWANCESEAAPSARAFTLSGEVFETLWSLDAAALCAAVGSGGLEGSGWAEACVDFERPATWSAPGLGFEVTRTGEYTGLAKTGLALDVDALRLIARDCVP